MLMSIVARRAEQKTLVEILVDRRFLLSGVWTGNLSAKLKFSR